MLFVVLQQAQFTASQPRTARLQLALLHVGVLGVGQREEGLQDGRHLLPRRRQPALLVQQRLRRQARRGQRLQVQLVDALEVVGEGGGQPRVAAVQQQLPPRLRLPATPRAAVSSQPTCTVPLATRSGGWVRTW